MTISAKNVAPSIRAAAMIIASWMLAAISGWRAMLSTAPLARLPIPIAAPMITRPTASSRRFENGAGDAGARGGLGRGGGLRDEQDGERQGDHLDEFHRSLNS